MSLLHSWRMTACRPAVLAMCMAAWPAGARIVPDADHTVWVTVDSTPAGADVYSLENSDGRPIRIGSTPCRVPVDLYWPKKWLVKRWERMNVESPGAAFRGELRADGTHEIILKARFVKPNYENQEIETTAFRLPHPGEHWNGKTLWPREARVNVTLRGVSSEGRASNATTAAVRTVWVAESRAVGETGSVIVHSNVEGADVWVDGRRVAVTPVELILYEGSHDVEVRRTGHISARCCLVVEPESRSEYEAVLEREP